jgi:peroxiredoxin
MSNLLDKQIEAAEQEWLDGWKHGPSRLRWNEPPVQIGDLAPNLELADSDGVKVQLRDLWRDQPLMIIFWRHFGCSCGVDRAIRLNREYAEYVATGGQVVVIAQGEPERATAYAKQYEIPCRILSDPTFSAYIAYGLLEGTPAQILFDAPREVLEREWAAGVKLAEERRAAGRPMVDSPWQLPGEFVIDTHGVIQLAYRYNFCEDWPDHRVFVAALHVATRTSAK